MKLIRVCIGVVFITAVIVLQSCATVFGGRHNSIVFEGGENIPAEVFIDDSLIGKAEGKIILPKKVIQHGSVLEIRADGYKTKEFTIVRKVHPWYTIGNFAVGLAPLAVDYATGNILRPVPRKFDAQLEKE